MRAFAAGTRLLGVELTPLCTEGRCLAGNGLGCCVGALFCVPVALGLLLLDVAVLAGDGRLLTAGVAVLGLFRPLSRASTASKSPASVLRSSKEVLEGTLVSVQLRI